MSKDVIWEYNGESFKLGDSVNNYPWEENNIFPIVWHKDRLYKAIIKPEGRDNKIDRVCLIDIYNNQNRPYWTTIDKIYNIIKQ